MKTKNKIMNEKELWQASNLGLINKETLSKENQRTIENYDEAMKNLIKDDIIKHFLDIYGDIGNVLAIKELAKYYKVDKYTIEIRIAQLKKQEQEEKTRVRVRN